MLFDAIIRKGRIVDGTGNPWFRADVAIRDRRIAKVGRCATDEADEIIDAEGLIVCPGFIDIHNHSEIHLIVNPNAASMVTQGITTLVVGNCGFSSAPVTSKNRDLVYSPWWSKEVKPTWNTLAEYFSILEKQGISVNVASLVGHGFVRGAIMGWEARLPAEEELEQMKELVAEAMKDGAVGLSSGLTYPPGVWSDTHELVELCKVVATYGGFYATHDRGTPYMKAKFEAIEIGEKAGCPVQISHIETHTGSFGQQDAVLTLVEEARQKGADVTFDVCTTIYGCGYFIGLVIPPWGLEGGAPRILERVSDPATRTKMRESMEKSRRQPAWDNIIVHRQRSHPEFSGKTVARIAKEWGKDPWDASYDMLKDDELDCVEIFAAVKGHDDDDLRKAIAHPFAMPNTDSWLEAPYGLLARGTTHPRAYGGFTIVFRKWVRGITRPDMPEEIGVKILTVEDTVRKMTSLPAQRLGLQDRGLIREGMYADIVVFDEKKIADKANYFGNTMVYSEGVNYVFVNGGIVIEKGEHIGSLPGKVMRGPVYKAP